jgi:hypothetical protein
MKPPFLLLLAAALPLTSCHRSGGRASSAAYAEAESFVKIFEQQLSMTPPAAFSPRGSSQSNKIKTGDYSFTVKSSDWGARDLYQEGEKAVRKWGRFDTFTNREQGGGRDFFHISFGGRDSHAFVDFIKSTEGGDTTIHCLIKAIE